MKKLSLFALALLCSLLTLAQWPYFQQVHNSASAGLTYAEPVDIQFDGTNKVFSYHASNMGGTIIVKYNTGTGTWIQSVYLSKSGVSYTPVRVRTQGSDYYALFNFYNSSVSNNRYALIRLNTTTNAVSFLRQVTNPNVNLNMDAVDFILDGGSNAYILSNTYDNSTGQSDMSVTKVNITTATIPWAITYQNTSRDEFGNNLILQNNTLFASGISVSTSSILDRGPVLYKIDVNGSLLGSRLYKYDAACVSVRSSGTWVMPGNNTLYLSSVSYVGADGNGPLWLAKIDPATLNPTLQVHHSSGAAYLNPEIQLVRANVGDRILMSGSAPAVNTSAPGYVHYYFDINTLAFTNGTKYTTTNPSNWSGTIYDTYINTGAGMNVFSVAPNAVTPTQYYLLKTSDLGDNACEVSVSINPGNCTFSQYDFPLTLREEANSLSIIKLFSVTTFTNSIAESCLVTCPGCEMPLEPVQQATPSRSGMTEESSLWPNPTNGKVTLSNASSISDMLLTNLLGDKLSLTVVNNGDQLDLDLSMHPKGIYLLQYLMNGERTVVRIVKE